MKRVVSVVVTDAYILATLALLACEKEEDERLRLDLPGPNAPGPIVGITGGFCPANCATVFLLRDGEVYPNEASGRLEFDAEDWAFAKTPLAEVEAALLDSLVNTFPEGIADFPEAAFGCPGCADGGVLPVVLVDADDRVTADYRLDDRTERLDERLRPYGELVRRAVSSWDR